MPQTTVHFWGCALRWCFLRLYKFWKRALQKEQRARPFFSPWEDRRGIIKMVDCHEFWWILFDIWLQDANNHYTNVCGRNIKLVEPTCIGFSRSFKLISSRAECVTFFLRRQTAWWFRAIFFVTNRPLHEGQSNCSSSRCLFIRCLFRASPLLYCFSQNSHCWKSQHFNIKMQITYIYCTIYNGTFW